VTPYYTTNAYYFNYYTDYRQRLIWFDENSGAISDSIFYNLSEANYVQDALLKDDGNLLVVSDLSYHYSYLTNKAFSRIYNLGTDGVASNISEPESILKCSFGAVCKTGDNHYVISGFMQKAGGLINQLVIIKTDENGNL
ncbi:MAG: hypothetical protein LH629_04215, partial [Ignavibacteria bacterium]|nr:hypothetical protein [Ignavibacteria bacterium]